MKKNDTVVFEQVEAESTEADTAAPAADDGKTPTGPTKASVEPAKAAPKKNWFKELFGDKPVTRKFLAAALGITLLLNAGISAVQAAHYLIGVEGLGVYSFPAAANIFQIGGVSLGVAADKSGAVLEQCVGGQLFVIEGVIPLTKSVLHHIGVLYRTQPRSYYCVCIFLYFNQLQSC